MNGTKKVKPNLPKDWIIVNSKSFPDRIYYFNVRTGKSAWTDPSLESTDKVAAAQLQNRKKRKKLDDDNEGPPLLKTPPQVCNMQKQANPADRPKLHAKRLSVPAEPTDTPQMRALREQLLQRKAKTENSKNNKRTIVAKVPARQLQSTGNSKNASCTIRKHIWNTPVQSQETKRDLPPLSPPNQPTPKTTRSRAQSGTPGKQVATTMTEKSLRTPPQLGTRKTVGSSTVHTGRVPDTGTSSRISDGANKSLSLLEKDSEQARTRLSKSVTPKSVAGKSGRSSLSPTKTVARKNSANKRLDNLRKSLGAENKKAEHVTTGKTVQKRVKSPEFVKNLEAQTTLLSGLRVPTNQELVGTSGRRSGSSLADNRAGEPSEPDDLPSDVYKNAASRLKSLRDRLGSLQPSPAKVPKTQNVSRRGKKLQKDLVDEHSTTVTNLIEECKKDVYYEEMDWAPIEEEKILTEIQEVRVQLGCNQSFSNQILNNSRENVFELPPTPQPADGQKLYVVVDTNVFLSNLKIIEEIRDTTFKNYNRPIIVVPWTVLQELDYIKDNRTRTKTMALEHKARRAVNFLHEHFSAKHPRVKGQTASDANANKSKFEIECPDDGILQSCLQIRETGSNVILLSYDKNLCNKAMVHDLTTLERDDSIKKIDKVVSSGGLNESHDNPEQRSKRISENDEDSPPSDKELEISDEMFSELKAVVKHFLSVIVAKEMANLYGELGWEKYTIVRPPWSVTDVLKCAVKHWIAAVGDAFNRRAEPLVKELLDVFTNSYKYCQKLKDVNSVLEKCNDLVQMIDPEKYQDLMIQAANSVKELQDICQEARKNIVEAKFQEGLDHEKDNLSAVGRAESAFQYFHEIWAYTSNFCGLAADMMGIPHTIPYERPNTIPSVENIKQLQPGLAASLIRLLHALKTVLEEADSLHPDHTALMTLNNALLNFLPDHCLPQNLKPLGPVDLLCCVREKKDILKTGLCQLQELNSYFCRMADLNLA